jgi:transcription elongation factor GreB
MSSEQHHYMTPGGQRRLRDELEHLVKIERPRMVEVVSWAASNGDRSENGDYLYGKKRLREIDRRIRFLMKRLENAHVVDPAAQLHREQVFFGATVMVCDESGAAATYSIVGIDEADPGKGWISWVSPLARALIKLREGDVARFVSPQGERELEILEVSYITIDVPAFDPDA